MAQPLSTARTLIMAQPLSTARTLIMAQRLSTPSSRDHLEAEETSRLSETERRAWTAWTACETKTSVVQKYRVQNK